MFGCGRNALRSHPNVNAVFQGHLEYATYVIAVREPNPQGEGERNTANRWESCRRRLTEGVVSISQGLGRREMEYTTPVIAAQKASPQGDAAWLAANH